MSTHQDSTLEGAFYHDLQARQQVDREFNAEVLAFYAERFGPPAFPSLGLVVAEGPTPGGHSPPGLLYLQVRPPVLRGRSLPDDPANFSDLPGFFLAHEAAHQWWGQAVGWRTYHDQWISEGFSQYFAALFARQRRGDDLFAAMIRRMAKWARDQGEAGPVSLGYRLGHIQGDSRIFRAIVYNKSAVALHMLRRMIGDDAFFRGVRRLYFGSRFAKAGTDDVRAAFEKESGRDLARFFNAWIYGSGTPEVAFTWAPAAGGRSSISASPAAAKDGTAEVSLKDAEQGNSFIPRLWATRRGGYLLDEIRLHGDHAGRQKGQDDDQCDDPGRWWQGPFMQQPAEQQGDAELHDFRGLEAYADVEPALCALADFAGGKYQNQQQQPEQDREDPEARHEAEGLPRADRAGERTAGVEDLERCTGTKQNLIR